jgi:prepilin-type N-terminal cleavage/methylation domain-containing protein
VRPTHHGRSGFTLVELLVVMGLILLLLTLVLYLVPTLQTEQQATQAGTMLQQWIEIAKQRAARDRAPRGIRLNLNGANSLQVTQLEYIEQPPDFFFGTNNTVAGYASSIGVNGGPNPGVVSRARSVYIPPALRPNTNTYWIKFEMFDPQTLQCTDLFQPPPPIGSPFALPRDLQAKGAIAPVQMLDHLEFGGNVYLVLGIAPKPPKYNVQSTDTLIVASEQNANVGLKVPSVPPASITINSIIPPGVQTVTPSAMPAEIGVGATVMVDAGTPFAECVTVTGVTPQSFTAMFKQHPTSPVSMTVLGYASTQYRIIRQARPIGDDPLQMPANMIIDLYPRGLGYDLVPLLTVVKANIFPGLRTVTPQSMNTIMVGTRLQIGSGPSAETVTVLGVTGTTFTAQFTGAHPGTAAAPIPVIALPPYFDILFSPDGRVLTTLATYDKIILWVRDVLAQGAPGDPPPAQNDPALVCIYPRTGLVAAFPVDTYLVNSNPYTFTNIGRRVSP